MYIDWSKWKIKTFIEILIRYILFNLSNKKLKKILKIYIYLSLCINREVQSHVVGSIDDLFIRFISDDSPVKAVKAN